MTVLNEQQCLIFAQGAGFNQADSLVMAKIAMAESGGDTDVIGPLPTHRNTDGTSDYGLWQINSSHTSLLTPAVLQSGAWRNAATNAHFARVVFDAQGFNAWSSYKKNPTKFTTGKLDPIPANAADVAAAKNQGILGTGLSIPNPVSAGIDSLGSTLTKVASNIATVLIALVLLVLGVLFAMHKDVRGAVKSIPKVLPI